MPEFGAAAVEAHVATHQDGGADELIVTGLAGDLADAQDPKAHHASHEDGASDELAVTGLSGELADAQPSTWAKVTGKPSTFNPEDHASDHENGGGDELSVEGLSGALADKQDADKLQGRDVVVTAPSDGQALVWDAGNTRWGPSTPAGYSVVHDETLTAKASYVDITGLDVNTDGFYVLILILQADAATNLIVDLLINGDTTRTNYYTQYLRVDSASVTGARANDPTIFSCTTAESGMAWYWITRTVNSRARATGRYQLDTPTSLELINRAWMFNGTVTNITSIRISESQGNDMAVGSRIILLKPPL